MQKRAFLRNATTKRRRIFTENRKKLPVVSTARRETLPVDSISLTQPGNLATQSCNMDFADNMSPQPKSIIIRPMILEDIPELAELYRQFWNQSSDILKMVTLLERLLTREDYIFLSAIGENKLIGSVYGIVCEQPYGICQPFLVLQNLIVDQAHRRKGVANFLLATLEILAIEKGCYHCDLITDAHREEAIRFYLAHGFEEHIGFRKRI